MAGWRIRMGIRGTSSETIGPLSQGKRPGRKTKKKKKDTILFFTEICVFD